MAESPYKRYAAQVLIGYGNELCPKTMGPSGGDPHVGLDNNAAENAIRPFAIGRNNWLFAGSPAGAKASVNLYSLVETARANGLEPYRYLRYIFEKLPFATTSDDYRKLTPLHLDRNAFSA